MRTDQRERAELLRASLTSFPKFCGLLDIIPKNPITGATEARCKFKFNWIQRRFSETRTGRDVVLKPRQVGFTTLEQARDIYHFLTYPGAQVVVTCQSLTDHTPAKNLAANYRLMFEGLERSGLILKFRTRTNMEWVLANNGATLRIVEAGASEAAAEKKGRSGRVSRLHLTETAFYEYADQTLNALLECVPARSTGSEIVSESTPNGAAGYFYRQCKAAESEQSSYKFHFFHWFDQDEYAVPLGEGETIRPETEREQTLVDIGVRPEQLKWYRQKVAEKGQDLADQEYPTDAETCFLVSGRSFFDQHVTASLTTKTKDPLEYRERNRVRIYEKPQGGEDYILAVDTSEGGGGDPSAGIMYKRSNGQHVATIDGQFPPFELARVAVELAKEYNRALLGVERNNHGHAVLLAVNREQKYFRVYRHEDLKDGWPTNPVTRPMMLDGLEDVHRQGLWSSPDRAVLAQMRTFIITDTGKAEAARGEHDDLVIAASIGWAIRSKGKVARGSLSGDQAAAMF